MKRIELTDYQKTYLNSIIDNADSKLSLQFINMFFDKKHIYKEKKHEEFDIQKISEVMRFDFSKEDEKINGITFTPISLILEMFEHSLDLDNITNKKIADISMGNGAFFVGLIIYMKKNNIDFIIKDFIENNIFGYEIKEENIYFAKISLSLIMIYFGENPENTQFNFYLGDSIKYYLNNQLPIFDYLIGNPPYVKQQNIPLEYRELIQKNFETVYSNYNLYYVFIEISLKLLNPDGRIIYLVPNYILKIKSAMKLRKFLLDKKSIYSVINFHSEKLFPGIDTYSMILTLELDSTEILYKNITSLKLLEKNLTQYDCISYDNVSNDTINLLSKNELDIVKKVSSQPGILDISTGIATQKDGLYLIDYIDNGLFYKEYDNTKYLIEKGIIKKIIKGSASKGIKELYIIYPYKIIDNRAILISPKELEVRFPNALRYFRAVKGAMLSRSGIKNDDIWYMYGRSQSLNRTYPKIVFPTNTDKPKFKIYTDDALFFNGYAIYGIKNKRTNNNELKAINTLLNSKLVEYFMKLTSYYIGGGYVSYQKKYLEKVTIPILTDEIITNLELKSLDNNNDHNLNKYILGLYGLEKYSKEILQGL